MFKKCLNDVMIMSLFFNVANSDVRKPILERAWWDCLHHK